MNKLLDIGDNISIGSIKDDIAIYVHYPFCKSKCPYCDFNSHLVEIIDKKQFLQAYYNQLQFFANKIGSYRVKSIFFGGGTPSLMDVDFAFAIINKIANIWALDNDCEITIEANPTSFEANKFKDFHKAGINRISLGIQSFDDNNLKFLGRNHNAKEAIKAINQAREIFSNLSFDLIYTLPEQKISDWLKELQFAISLNSNHLSLYQLTIEKGTKFFTDHQKKKFIMPDEEISYDFYQKTNEILEYHKFYQYEISNYCIGNYQSRHNLAYWQGCDYIGIGAGAHSRVFFNQEKFRKAIIMEYNPKKWTEMACKYSFYDNKIANSLAIWQINDIDNYHLAQELILTALRTSYGLELQKFANLLVLNNNNNNLDNYSNPIKNTTNDWQYFFDIDKLNKVIKSGLVTIDNNHLKITKNNFVITNFVIEKVISCLSCKLTISTFK